jgi:glycosyltransferase involved in cell wall biosynthesis
MSRIAIITNVIPSYREDFYNLLISRFGEDITIYCQDDLPGMQLKLVHNHLQKNIKLIKYWSLQKESVAWQWLPLRELYRNYDIYIFFGNPRILSSLLFATLFFLVGKKVVIWGQWHTAGASPVLEKIRLRWWRLFDFILLYTEKGADYLRKRGFNHHTMIGLNNGLNQSAIESEKKKWTPSALEQWRRNKNIHARKILLSCARLEPKNCFNQFVEALKKIIALEPNVLWCVIGDGVEAEHLHASAKDLSEHILWLGPIYGEKELAPWFLSATALVHPGAIGLTLLHAYGYSLPVITHTSDYDQMPEISAMPVCNRQICFKQNDIDSLIEKTLWALSNPQEIRSISNAVLQVALEGHNTQVMAQRFCAMINAVEATTGEKGKFPLADSCDSPKKNGRNV